MFLHFRLLSTLAILSMSNGFNVKPNPNDAPVNLDKSQQRRRQLPEKVLIGYANNCDEKVKEAVRHGLNVVVWSFFDLQKDDGINVNIRTSLDIDCIQKLIHVLDAEGFDDTIHLTAFGGWNGPHLNAQLSAEEWYNSWKDNFGHIFHGIDWDPEGHDDLSSPTNFFTIKCLEQIGQISKLAKEDGYIVSMAPAQSYLDIHTSKYSRNVNLTDTTRSWHNDFHYFGANVYAYILAKYGTYIDLISIQFYESYSRAAMTIHHDNVAPIEYLQSYIQTLVKQNESYFVNFEQDESIELSSQHVSIPLSKLVFGFANGWALADSSLSEKVIYFDPHDIQIAYNNLRKDKIAPRGFMFWVITEEGTNDIYYTQSLNKILQIRKRQDATSSSSSH